MLVRFCEFYWRLSLGLFARLFAPLDSLMVLDVSENSVRDEVREGSVFLVSLVLKEVFELGGYSETDHNFHGSL